MKNRIKIFTFVILLAVFVFTPGNFVRAEAEIKDGSYRFAFSKGKVDDLVGKCLPIN